ncbi:hypothetical protein D3C71_1861540 [compost metagenome]
MQLGSLGCIDAEFFDDFTGFHAGFGEVTRQRLGNAACAAAAEGDLNRGITVGLVRLDLRHAVVADLDHGNGNRITVVRENTGHANLATYKAKAHGLLHSQLRLAGAD